MKEERRSIGILKNRKAVILDVPFINESLLVGVTDRGVPVYLIDSIGQLWPEYTGLAGQIFTYMISDNEIICAEEICCKDGYRQLVRDTGCRIEDFVEIDRETLEQEWKFARVIGEF